MMNQENKTEQFWESKAWFVVERIVSLITLLVLSFAVWNSLLRIETKVDANSKRQDRIEQIISTLKHPEKVHEKITRDAYRNDP